MFLELIKKNIDLEYKKFSLNLIPGYSEDEILGVRIPVLRKLAKELFINNYKEVKKFLNNLPHKYFEEDNLHGYLLENIKDINLCLEETNKFLPYINNWATCDTFCPKIFEKYKDLVLKNIKVWIKSDKEYVVRYAIGLLMRNYLDESFDKKFIDWVLKIKTDKYYINMMIAWYVCEGLVKRYNDFIYIIDNKLLDDWVHNKAIQKSMESYRISKENKEYLKKLKIKK